MSPSLGPSCPKDKGGMHSSKSVMCHKQNIPFYVWSRGRFSEGAELMQDEPREWEFLRFSPLFNLTLCAFPRHIHSRQNKHSSRRASVLLPQEIRPRPDHSLKLSSQKKWHLPNVLLCLPDFRLIVEPCHILFFKEKVKSLSKTSL